MADPVQIERSRDPHPSTGLGVNGVARRRFLGWAGAALSSVAAALASVPVLGAVLGPTWVRRKSSPRGFLPAAHLADLVMGVPKRVDLVSDLVDGWAVRDNTAIGSAWLVRLPGDRVVAYSTLCPHLGCPVSFNGSAAFQCPCHGSYFQLDGAPSSGPARRGLDPLDVSVAGGVVSVRYARFRLGGPERAETQDG